MGKFGLNFFKPTEKFNGNWSILESKSREWEKMYRERWSHDKEVRTTHGVNCTGSCSWKVFVKNGVITWENQQTDYPSCGPDMPEYEPRGCPRGASFSWYEYSPLRIKYPYIRGKLWDLWTEALEEKTMVIALLHGRLLLKMKTKPNNISKPEVWEGTCVQIGKTLQR